MRRDTFEALAPLVAASVRSQTPVGADVLAQFPDVALETVISFRRQEYTRHVRRSAHKHRKPEALRRYEAQWRAGASIMDISERVNYSPYLLARLFVERLCGVPRTRVGALMKSPGQITDDRLRAEVVECIELDVECSPFVDRVKRSVGAEYEFILQERLRNRGISFESEDQLRLRGQAKTPDVRLLAPIGVLGPDGRARVVQWIDSKAMFGSPDSVQEAMQQFRGYVNRYGPGMAIFWHDVVDGACADPDILLLGDFPEVVALPGASEEWELV